MKRIRLSITVITLCLVSACGYQFQGSGTVLPDDVRTVGIAPVENNTTEIGLDLSFAEALRSRFERYGVIRVIDNYEDADATLYSKIVSLDGLTRNTTDSDIALSSDLVMMIAGELRKDNGQILWKNDQILVTESFAATSDVVVTSSSDFASSSINTDTLGNLNTLEVSRGQRGESIEKLLEEAARKIYFDAVAEDF